jgi:hypothetical protein
MLVSFASTVQFDLRTEAAGEEGRHRPLHLLMAVAAPSWHTSATYGLP